MNASQATARLQPCTIIPDDLYVERGADRQLARNIDQMGRPAYVLVARQMGKTNLLLHAKRRAAERDVFVYVDVSNVVPDLRSFLRGIVDSCVDECRSPELQDIIDKRRQSSNLQLEHREHERELKEVLGFVAGKLVIFLDEIDALTKVSYSDKVFSFIRSIYFSGRTNFGDFDRLTYVLSGVAEPSEIIKNRDISPFNIGEKIYLDDFSREEVDQFLAQAAVEWPAEVVERVYYWTGGNPRLTWDVVSALESRVLVSVDDVDSVVNQMYLASFDLPPVDHIRALARADKEIRSAIMSIHYGKADQISDSTAAKLYLAGIVSASVHGESLRIKNRIIEMSLSERWLSDTERSEIPSFGLALSLYEEGRYREAVEVYSALEESGGHRDIELINFRRAQCFYALKEYPEALAAIANGIYPRSKSLDLYLASSALCGAIQIILGKTEESVVSFERVVREAVDNDLEQPAIIVKSKLNLSAAYLKLGNSQKAKELCFSVIKVILPVNEQDGAITQADSDALTAAHFNIYQALLDEGSREEARDHLQAAISRARPSEKPALMLEDVAAFEGGGNKGQIIEGCIRHCIDTWLPLIFDYNAERPLSFRFQHGARLLLEMAKIDPQSDILDEFIDFSGRSDVGHKVSAYTLLAFAAVVGLGMPGSESQRAVKVLLEKASELEVDDIDGGRLMATCLEVTYSAKPNLKRAASVLLEVEPGGRPNEALYIYSSQRVAWHLIEEGDCVSALSILEGLSAHWSTDEPGVPSAFDLAGEFLKIVADSKCGVAVSAARVVDVYRRLSSNVDLSQGFYDSGDIYHMRVRLVSYFPQYLQPSRLLTPRAVYARNQLVTVIDGKGVKRVVKFKKVEGDVRSGNLTIVSE